MIFPPYDFQGFTPEEFAVDAAAGALHFERWFKNHIATMQGALGAERLQPKALASNMIAAIGAAGVSPAAGVTDIGRYRGFGVHFEAENANSIAGNDLQISFSSGGGTSWGGWRALFGAQTFVHFTLVGRFDIFAGTSSFVIRDTSVAAGVVAHGTASFTPAPLATNAFRLRLGGTGSNGRFAALVTAEEGRADV